ncbi:MAG: YdeI/OmpD-associated family protein [Bacteroidia bacterium]|nr:YdeI/OmpD-associated family protein [Bacteroidia bacterium]
MEKPIVDSSFVIQQQAGKGGWRYVVIPDIPSAARSSMGLVRVKGFVDTYAIRQFNLLPMKDGSVCLPLKAALRKSIQKEAGDRVHVTLFTDTSAVEIPPELLDVLRDAPKAYDFFQTLSDSNKKYYLDWIADARKMETKTSRVIRMIRLLERGIKFWDWPAPDKEDRL